MYADLTSASTITRALLRGKLAYSIVDSKNPASRLTPAPPSRFHHRLPRGRRLHRRRLEKDITWERFIEIGRDVRARPTPDALRPGGRGGYRSHHAPELRRVHVREDGSVSLKNNEQLKEVIGFYATMVKAHLHRDSTWGRVHQHALKPDRRRHHSGLLDSLHRYGTAGSEGSVGDDPAQKLVRPRARPATPATAAPPGDHQRQGHRRARPTVQMYRNVRFYNEILPATSAIATYTPAKKAQATLRAPVLQRRTDLRRDRRVRRTDPVQHHRPVLLRRPRGLPARRSPTSFSRAATWIPSCTLSSAVNFTHGLLI